MRRPGGNPPPMLASPRLQEPRGGRVTTPAGRGWCPACKMNKPCPCDYFAELGLMRADYTDKAALYPQAAPAELS